MLRVVNIIQTLASFAINVCFRAHYNRVLPFISHKYIPLKYIHSWTDDWLVIGGAGTKEIYGVGKVCYRCCPFGRDAVYK